ncbi:ATP-dependent metallopeptidase FtsH/Yme1/Tma family protein, partial [Clostridium sp. HCS.1]
MTTDQISYNRFLNMLENQQVESVVISSSDIKILPKENEDETSKRKILYTGNVNDPNLINLLNESGVEYSAETIKDNFFADFIFRWVIMPIILFSIFR